MPLRLMLVEDDEALVELLRYNFTAAGYVLEPVIHGDEAEARLKEAVPDLLILDWMLPGLSGIELCRRLRQKPRTQRLPIIMLTARGEEPDRLRGFETGADDYVVKPFSVNELVARASRLLHAPKEGVHGLDVGLGGHGEGNQSPARGPAHRRDVGEIHGQGLPADVGRSRRDAAEVDVLDHQVCGGQQPMTGRHREHGRVVADADLDASIPGCDLRCPDTANQSALAQLAQAHPFWRLRRLHAPM